MYLRVELHYSKLVKEWEWFYWLKYEFINEIHEFSYIF